MGGQWTIRVVLRRSLWFMVISTSPCVDDGGSGAEHSCLRSYNSEREKESIREEEGIGSRRQKE